MPKVVYSVPTVKVFQYTEEEIFQKRLLLFLPYYILRYEKDADDLENDPVKRSRLVEQYKKMYSRINQMYAGSDKDRASDLIGLIMNVQDYVFRNQDCVRKELKSMGGKVIQLESGKILRRVIKKASLLDY